MTQIVAALLIANPTGGMRGSLRYDAAIQIDSSSIPLKMLIQQPIMYTGKVEGISEEVSV